MSVVSILSRPPSYFPFVLDNPPSLGFSPYKSSTPSKEQLLDWKSGDNHEISSFQYPQLSILYNPIFLRKFCCFLMKSHPKLPSSASRPNLHPKTLSKAGNGCLSRICQIYPGPAYLYHNQHISQHCIAGFTNSKNRE